MLPGEAPGNLAGALPGGPGNGNVDATPQIDPKIAAALEREKQQEERKARKAKEVLEKKEADKAARAAWRKSPAGIAKDACNKVK